MTSDSEDEDLSPQPEELPGGRAVQLAAAVAAGGISIASMSPAAVMIATTLPVIAELAFDLDRRAWVKRIVRGGQVIEAAAEDLDITVAELAEKTAQSDAGTELLGRIIRAAGSTLTLEKKIPALAKALAMGLRDDTRIDEAASLASALEAIEVGHVRVLGALHQAFQNTEWENQWVSGDEIREMSGLEVRGLSLMNVLVAHGLAQQEAGGFDGGDATGRASGIPPVWQITQFGVVVLDFLGYEPSGYSVVPGRRPLT